MFWRLDNHNELPLTCSPKTVAQYATFPIFLETKRFPLSPERIDEMSDYFDKVNQILSSWGVEVISLTDLIMLKWVLNLEGNELEDRLLEFEENKRNLALWLHFYLELREPVEDDDPTWKNAYREHVSAILSTSTEL